MSNAHESHLVWIDLEMSGLDTASDTILEIATIVTDADLHELAVGPVFAIKQAPGVLEGMDDWNTKHHRDSGLWKRCVEEGVSLAQAESATLDFLDEWTITGASPICGNSICQDRRFLHREMPRLEAWFHYRNLDVSTLKELAARWAPELLSGFTKTNRHEALSDIRESIAELRYYRQHMGNLSGLLADY